MTAGHYPDHLSPLRPIKSCQRSFGNSCFIYNEKNGLSGTEDNAGHDREQHFENELDGWME